MGRLDVIMPKMNISNMLFDISTLRSILVHSVSGLITISKGKPLESHKVALFHSQNRYFGVEVATSFPASTSGTLLVNLKT
jgi:hypothetical protein